MPRVGVVILALTTWAVSAFGVVPVDPPRDPDSLRPNWRWIGVKAQPGTACPPAAGFAVAPMFPGTENTRLARYCVYESAASQPGQPQPAGELVRLDRDAMAVVPSGGALEDALWPALAAHFQSQAGDFEPPITGALPARLAIVDTAATRETGGENFPGTSPHGYALLNIARRLTCAGAGETACLAQVSSRLALGWDCFDREQLDAGCRNPVAGGWFGLIGEMAQAIHAEVRQWRTVGPPELVLNLSIGWDPIFGGLETQLANMPAPVAAVHAAVEDAVCRGAVVIAAAGNREGGPTPEVGPIVPAAWEGRSAPTFPTCVSLGTAPDPADFPGAGAGSAYRPLVYAVGGVRADDGSVFNSRKQSAPPLAAFGDHALVATLSGAPTTALAGSSGAALVVSAAAAATAHYRPDLKPYERMAAVYGGGRDLGRAPDFCLGGAPCPASTLTVRRVSMCETVAHACPPGTGARCPASPPICAQAPPLDLSGVDLATFRQAATPLDLAGLTVPYAPLPECRFEQLRHAQYDAPADPCPHWQYYPRAPARATQPQPGSYPCPNCTYELLSGTLYVEIDSAYDGELTEPTLKCGEKTWSLDGPEPWLAGDKAEVAGVQCPAGELMQVSFTLDGSDSATSPVLVVP